MQRQWSRSGAGVVCGKCQEASFSRFVLSLRILDTKRALGLSDDRTTPALAAPAPAPPQPRRGARCPMSAAGPRSVGRLQLWLL